MAEFAPVRPHTDYTQRGQRFDGVSHNQSHDLIEQEVSSLLSLVVICKEICLITVGLTEANVTTVLASWLSK